MKQDYFETEFVQNNFPKYDCPSCKKSELVVSEFKSTENGYTKRNRSDKEWDFEWDQHLFSATLECKGCRETVFCTGDGFVDEEIDEIGHGSISRSFFVSYRPKFFYPSLKFIAFPIATPKEVQESINTACAVYHSFPASACNSLRIAAEDVLTSLGVAEPEAGEYISLAKRSKDLPENSQERVLLDAIRWLGNDGSHSKTLITHRDAQDAFVVMDLLIEKVYSDREMKIQELAKAISEHKGPVRRRGLYQEQLR